VPLYSEHPFFAPQTRWVLENCGHLDPYSIDEYLARGGYRAAADVLRGKSPREVCDEVIDAGLRGRGGGGFPAGRKWKIALEQPAEQKYMICNADEGDPGAFMDRAVIEGDPHRLVEGMLIAAYAIGATKSYVYIRAEYPLAIERLRLAIDQARELGLLGDDLFGTGFEFDIKIKMGAGAFVCGEETAILASVEGKRGMPRPRPPFPAVSGLWGKPTILNNVETLANLPFLMREGAATFSGVGTAGSKGTKVFALSGKVSRTGLVEVAMGTTVRDIIFGIGGGIPHGKQYKAVQMGGPSGGCIPEQHLDIEVDYDSLLEVGAMMGSGGMVAMDEDTCMVDVAKFFMDFIQRESCGKCIPCREGTRRMLEILTAITRPTREESGHDALSRFQGVIELEKLAGVIKDTSLCGLGQSAPNPVLSTLRWFRHEYEAHVFERSCPAAACLGLLSYSIDADACKGCTLCAKNCPTGAILGDRKEVHRIDQERCIACGSCITSCEFDAVIAK
jgi:NADH:ubiquinone oxidoreductase subunit F (NADH-binding)/Pyruvate/2-oxoacid:ferredoxin oxidoreductase delta subunit